MTAPTILRPVPDLTTRRVVDLAAWRAEIERRREANAAERAQRAAVIASQVAAGKPAKPKRARKPRPPSRARILYPTFAPCTGCGRVTRANRVKAADAPGTVSRYRAGMCKACACGGAT